MCVCTLCSVKSSEFCSSSAASLVDLLLLGPPTRTEPLPLPQPDPADPSYFSLLPGPADPLGTCPVLVQGAGL